MASNDDRSSTDNKASIALLRRLRAGGDDVHFVHRVEVCAAVPEILVADLEPVPGTGGEDDGYSRKWYFYHAKKYKNTRGDASGHRLRSVTGGGGTGWHSEKSRQDVEGSGGGTFCNFSYGLRKGKSIDRMGWCMIEYDCVAADKQQDEADDSSNYVLCKVYRSPRAKGKPASSSSKKQTAKKRKAGGRDHPEAPPAKSMIQMMVGGEDECGVQQPRVEPVYNFGELINIDEQAQMLVQQDPAAFFTDAYPMMPACNGHGGPQGVFGGVFNFQDLLKADQWKDFEDFLAEGEQGLQQPCAEPTEPGCEFVVPGHVSVC